MNTHFDHIGKVAKRESAKLILEKIYLYTKKNNYPIIMMGDFNCISQSETYEVLTNLSDVPHVTDSRLVADIVSGPEWSYHDFGRQPVKERELIDYVFVKNGVNVSTYEVIDGTKTGEYPSDHNAVMVTLEF
ncbi:MAG: endonuclease/exonuclease/phosphatase family protein [Paludibacteraceae bacterium]